jgi:hypothetical protein
MRIAPATKARCHPSAPCATSSVGACRRGPCPPHLPACLRYHASPPSAPRSCRRLQSGRDEHFRPWRNLAPSCLLLAFPHHERWNALVSQPACRVSKTGTIWHTPACYRPVPPATTVHNGTRPLAVPRLPAHAGVCRLVRSIAQPTPLALAETRSGPHAETGHFRKLAHSGTPSLATTPRRTPANRDRADHHGEMPCYNGPTIRPLPGATPSALLPSEPRP